MLAENRDFISLLVCLGFWFGLFVGWLVGFVLFFGGFLGWVFFFFGNGLLFLYYFMLH